MKKTSLLFLLVLFGCASPADDAQLSRADAAVMNADSAFAQVDAVSQDIASMDTSGGADAASSHADASVTDWDTAVLNPDAASVAADATSSNQDAAYNADANQGFNDASPSRDASATVDATVPPILSAEQARLCLLTFRSVSDLHQLGENLISIGAEAVFMASSFNGGVVTYTGTLTQALDQSSYSYAATPGDRMLVVFADGNTLELVYSVWNGYIAGNLTDFLNSHNMDFTIKQPAKYDVRIMSQSAWGTPESSVYEYRLDKQRQYSGITYDEGSFLTHQIAEVAIEQWSVSGNFTFLDSRRQYSGNISDDSVAINVAESSHDSISHNAQTGVHVQNHQIWNSNTTTTADATYVFDNAHVSWAQRTQLYGDTAYNVVTDTNYWAASGTMHKDGELFGVVSFDGPVLEDSHGPDLVLWVSETEKTLLHSLIVYP